MTCISDVRTLRQWVNDRVGAGTTAAEIDDIAMIVRIIANRPRWGTDWSAFIETLPDNLTEMLGEDYERREPSDY